MSSIFGWMASARAMPTRCFMPPDSSAGRFFSAPVRCTRSMYFWQCARTRALSHSGQREVDRERDVSQHSEPRHQRVALEDHRAIEAGTADLAPAHEHVAVGRGLEAGEDVEYGGLAAAGMPDQADELALLHPEVDVLEHRRVRAVARRRSAWRCLRL